MGPSIRRKPLRRAQQQRSRQLLLCALPCIFLSAFLIFLLTPSGSNNNANNDSDGNVAASPPKKNDNTWSSSTSQRDRLLHNAQSKLRNTGLKLRDTITSLTEVDNNLPARVRQLRQSKEIVGERLIEVKDGRETVEEILHGSKHHSDETTLPSMTLNEITAFLSDYLHGLHEACAQIKRATYEEIWQTYHDLTVKTLYPWDREYLKRMPPRKFDDTIFLSLATYRDENCLNTMKWAYEKAKHPERLYVGLVQQNCEAHCRSGILDKKGTIVDVEPDDDCHKLFCESPEGKKYCDRGQVRALHINETESLGPYAARYFASKLWYGEQWYMQIDAHMTFLQDWDAISIEMLQKAPSNKPVLSHYPPSHLKDLSKMVDEPAPRLCGPVFATSDLEAQIIRLEGCFKYDTVKLDIPRFAPFTAAGYFVAHSDFLREVPFDPFLPWIFMGEEIIMSSRLWTSGYDIFSPTQSVVGHIYVRRHKPKFWESVHRVFTHGIHNPLQMMILNRVKYQLGYPEAAKDMLKPKSVLTAVEQYTMGTERSVEEYLRIVGLNMTRKEVTYTEWCETGKPPPGFEQYAHLYK